MASARRGQAPFLFSARKETMGAMKLPFWEDDAPDPNDAMSHLAQPILINGVPFYRNGRHLCRLEECADEFVDPVDAMEAKQREEIEAEFGEAVTAAVQRAVSKAPLSHEQLARVHVIVIQGYSYGEASEIFGKAKATLHESVHRALVILEPYVREEVARVQKEFRQRGLEMNSFRLDFVALDSEIALVLAAA